MTITPLAAAALRVINAAWVNGTSYDLASQAAYALESAQMLQSPETATEAERLRARVAELEQQVIGVRAVHMKYPDSEHCQHDGQQWPCPTMQAAEVAPDEYPAALPWARLMDAEDLADFLDELAAAAITHADSSTALSEVEDACGRWRAIAEAQHAHNTAPGPDAQEPATPGCACEGPVPFALTPQATSALARPAVDKLRRFLAPSSRAGA
ncbi:hypothetical protein [Streptomyces decoyicus]